MRLTEDDTDAILHKLALIEQEVGEGGVTELIEDIRELVAVTNGYEVTLCLRLHPDDGNPADWEWDEMLQLHEKSELWNVRVAIEKTVSRFEEE